MKYCEVSLDSSYLGNKLSYRCEISCATFVHDFYTDLNKAMGCLRQSIKIPNSLGVTRNLSKFIVILFWFFYVLKSRTWFILLGSWNSSILMVILTFEFKLIFVWTPLLTPICLPLRVQLYQLLTAKSRPFSAALNIPLCIASRVPSHVKFF